jgi:hypothetical protein
MARIDFDVARIDFYLSRIDHDMPRIDFYMARIDHDDGRIDLDSQQIGAESLEMRKLRGSEPRPS